MNKLIAELVSKTTELVLPEQFHAAMELLVVDGELKMSSTECLEIERSGSRTSHNKAIAYMHHVAQLLPTEEGEELRNKVLPHARQARDYDQEIKLSIHRTGRVDYETGKRQYVMIYAIANTSDLPALLNEGKEVQFLTAMAFYC